MKNIIFAIALSLTLFSCDSSVDTRMRSGTINNDYIEEPLNSFSKKYENALATSNIIIEHIIKKEYSVIHSKYVEEEVKNMLTIHRIQSACDKMTEIGGPIIKYKKMQWGFLPLENEPRKSFYSFKIIEHKNKSLNYYFLFVGDGSHDKILGFGLSERDGPRSPTKKY